MEKKTKEQYFNFPIQLLDGFLVDTKECLDQILYYALYAHSEKLEYGDEIETFKSSAEHFGVTLGNTKEGLNLGGELYYKLEGQSPKVGIKLSIFWDFYKNHKTEFEKVCLLGFLAIKSIVQNKSYCKITNKYWLSRMDGRSHSVSDLRELSEDIYKYANEYQTKKIKGELEDNWNLVTYSRYTRGFFVSFKLDIDKLIYQAELKRKSTKEKQRKFIKKLALERALDKIENSHE